MPHAPLVTNTPQDPVTLFAPASQTITASGASPNLDTTSLTNGLVSVFVTGVTGTNPSLAVFVDVLMPDGNWFQILALTAIITGPNYSFGNFGPMGGGYVLTATARVRWTVSGTGSPTFTGVTICAVGR